MRFSSCFAVAAFVSLGAASAFTAGQLTSITTITDAITGHVLASGEVVGLGSAPTPGATH